MSEQDIFDEIQSGRDEGQSARDIFVEELGYKYSIDAFIGAVSGRINMRVGTFYHRIDSMSGYSFFDGDDMLIAGDCIWHQVSRGTSFPSSYSVHYVASSDELTLSIHTRRQTYSNISLGRPVVVRIDAVREKGLIVFTDNAPFQHMQIDSGSYIRVG